MLSRRVKGYLFVRQGHPWRFAPARLDSLIHSTEIRPESLYRCTLQRTFQMKRYELGVYQTEEGKAPFQEWVNGIRDQTARTLVNAQIRKAELGNFGDWKVLTGAGGIREMRVHYGPGFRIYYIIAGQKVILLLAGSTKKEQDRTIAKAKEYLADYNRRTGQ